MKHLYNFVTILCAITFALAACDAQPTNTTDSTASTGSADSGSIPSSDGTGGGNDATVADMIGKPGTFTIKGTTPDSKPVTFYVFVRACPSMSGENGFKTYDLGKFGKKYESVTSFAFVDTAASTDDDYCVFADRANYMFAYKKIVPTSSDSGKILELAWGAGEWGLAPNGDYESADGTEKNTFTTTVKNGKLWISGYASSKSAPMITYNKWSFEDDVSMTEGTILDDLSSITYYYKAKKTGKEFSRTVLRK